MDPTQWLLQSKKKSLVYVIHNINTVTQILHTRKLHNQARYRSHFEAERNISTMNTRSKTLVAHITVHGLKEEGCKRSTTLSKHFDSLKNQTPQAQK